MAARKIHEYANEPGTIKVATYRDSEWQEWHVRLILKGMEHMPARYHTDSKDDAMLTAHKMFQDALIAAQTPQGE